MGITAHCSEPGCEALPDGLLDFENHMRWHEDHCDACDGLFSTTMDGLLKAECDSPVLSKEECPFVPGPIDNTFCEVDGWMKIEHDLGRDLRVHESCFLDHDDILVRA